jgi:hypothetical protein
MDCNTCGGELYEIEGLRTDRDGIRNDKYCAECETRWGSRAHGLVFISQSVDQSDVTRRNKELENTIRVMMGLKEDG